MKWALLVPAWVLFTASTLWAAEREAAGGPDVGALTEKLRHSIVMVTYNAINDTGARIAQQCVGTLADDKGVVLMQSEMMPRSMPDDRFVDFKIKFVNEPDAPEIKAELIVRDPDLACSVVKLAGELPKDLKLRPAVIGDYAALKSGEELLALGLLPNVYQNTLNFSLGHVIKLQEKPQPLILVTATAQIALFGPAVNAKGEVVGFAVNDPSFNANLFRQNPLGNETAHVLMPASRLLDLVKEPEKRKHRPWLGIADLQPLSKDLAVAMGLNEKQSGLIVGRVLEGQPAAQAGIEAEDVLIKLNEEAITASDDTGVRAFQERLKKLEIGQKVKLTLLRKGQEKVVEMAVGEKPKEEADALRTDIKDYGLVVRELVYGDLLARDLGPDYAGLMVHYVKSGSWPDLAGMRAGDIITKVDDLELKGSGKETLEQFQKALAQLKDQKKKEFLVFVSRGRKGQNSALIKIEPDWK